jgi:hypothetical protein
MQPKEGSARQIYHLLRSIMQVLPPSRRREQPGAVSLALRSTRPSADSVPSPTYVTTPPSDCFHHHLHPRARTARSCAGCRDRPGRAIVNGQDALRLLDIFLDLTLWRRRAARREWHARNYRAHEVMNGQAARVHTSLASLRMAKLLLKRSRSRAPRKKCSLGPLRKEHGEFPSLLGSSGGRAPIVESRTVLWSRQLLKCSTGEYMNLVFARMSVFVNYVVLVGTGNPAGERGPNMSWCTRDLPSQL